MLGPICSYMPSTLPAPKVLLQVYPPSVSSWYILQVYPAGVSSGCILLVYPLSVSSRYILWVYPPGISFGYVYPLGISSRCILWVYPPGISSGCILQVYLLNKIAGSRPQTWKWFQIELSCSSCFQRLWSSKVVSALSPQ